jgi:hypothetical protein
VGLLGDGIARHWCAAGIAEQKNLLIPQIDQSAKRFMPLFPPSAAHGFDSSIDDLLFAGVRTGYQAENLDWSMARSRHVRRITSRTAAESTNSKP